MTNANANDGKTSPVLPTLEQVYALLKANYKPARFADRDGEIWEGMSIHGTWQDPVCKTREIREIICIQAFRPDGRWIQFLVLTRSLFADIRTEVSKMAGCAGELE
nr:hypothetical protein [Escherichia coli]